RDALVATGQAGGEAEDEGAKDRRGLPAQRIEAEELGLAARRDQPGHERPPRCLHGPQRRAGHDGDREELCLGLHEIRRGDAHVPAKAVPIVCRSASRAGRSGGRKRNAGTAKTPKSAAVTRKVPEKSPRWARGSAAARATAEPR